VIRLTTILLAWCPFASNASRCAFFCNRTSELDVQARRTGISGRQFSPAPRQEIFQQPVRSSERFSGHKVSSPIESGFTFCHEEMVTYVCDSRLGLVRAFGPQTIFKFAKISRPLAAVIPINFYGQRLIFLNWGGGFAACPAHMKRHFLYLI
jgi:hypothetical protein